MDAGRRGFLRLAGLAPIGVPVLAAEVLRAPAAGQLGAPRVLKSFAGVTGLQAQRIVLDASPALSSIDTTLAQAQRLLAQLQALPRVAEAATASLAHNATQETAEPSQAPPLSHHLPIASVEARQGLPTAIVPGAAS